MPFIKTDFSIPLAELRKDTGKEKAGGEEGGSNNFRPVCKGFWRNFSHFVSNLAALGLKCRVFEGTPGSAYAEFGETKVLARVWVMRSLYFDFSCFRFEKAFIISAMAQMMTLMGIRTPPRFRWEFDAFLIGWDSANVCNIAQRSAAHIRAVSPN